MIPAPDGQIRFFGLNKINSAYKIGIALAIAVLSTAVINSNGFHSSAAAFNPLVADEWDEVFDTARSVLAKLPDPSRIETTIKDPALRQAVLRAYQSLKTCAKVNRDQNRGTKQGALAEFERDFKSVRAEAEHGDYQSCAATCSTDGMKCEKDCAAARKKLCACKIIEFGSFVTKCVFG